MSNTDRPDNPAMPADAAAAIEQMIKCQLAARGIEDHRVLDAMRRVPRHHFVPEVTIEQAYSDRALATLENQTISQPFIVARMTELLDVDHTMRVLEVGTGSGYQTAILAALGASVVTIERHSRLAEHARHVLATLGLAEAERVEVVVGDGTLGDAQRGPYDRILITAAAPEVPAALCGQLAEGGRIVLPLGDREMQRLTVVERKGGGFEQTTDITCRFVPLIGEQGWGGDA